MAEQRLVIVSNRGPAQFERGADGERVVQRGGGGLVTALTGLVARRHALWVASAMTEEDVAVAREAGDDPISLELDEVSYDVCLVESDATRRHAGWLRVPLLSSGRRWRVAKR